MPQNLVVTPTVSFSMWRVESPLKIPMLKNGTSNYIKRNPLNLKI